MEKEEAIKLLVNLAKSAQPLLKATPQEHEDLKAAIDLLDIKVESPVAQ